ncbi:MAG: 3'-5' exoribonuclease [Candidatus Margulisbacteria bacterium]|nr:3'-5' exoribonuclease [Candidatus Margulisiibacteriota bacterium]
MIADLLKDEQYKELEKEYRFLARARGDTIDKLECVVFDLETTGLEPTINEITEIGALKVKGSEVTDMFSSLIKPRAPISAEITRLTSIDDEMVKDSPAVEQVLPKFIQFVGQMPLIAHNAVFDISFIREMLRRTNQPAINNSVICTVKLARHLLPELANHKLHTVAQHFGLKVANRHRAMGDVELTFQVWTKFLPLLSEKMINSQRELDVLLSRM